MSLSGFAVRRPVAVTMFFVAIVLLLVGQSVQDIQTLMRGGGTTITDEPA